MFPKKAYLIIIATTFLFSFYLFFIILFQPNPYFGGIFLFISSTFIFLIYVSLVLLDQYKKNQIFSPISLYSILMLFHFIMPGISIPFYTDFFSDPLNFLYIGEAQAYTLICFFIFHLGYVSLNFKINRRKISALNYESSEPWKGKWVCFTIILLLVGGWAIRFYIFESLAYSQFARQYSDLFGGRFDSVLRMIELFPRYALMITCIHYWNINNNLRTYNWRWAIILQIIFELFYWFPAGRKTEIILTIVLPIIIRYLTIKKLPSRKTIVFLLLSLILLFPIMYYYRTAMDIGGFSEIESIEDISSSIEVAKNLDPEHRKSALNILLGRISLLESVCGSIRIIRTNIWEPFFGKTYFWATIGIIPGILWENKPDFSFGTEFGHASGILNYSNKVTSISVTYIGESFLNFEWFGIFVFFFFGIGFSLLYKWVKNGEKESTRLLMYSLIIPSAIYIGGTFAQYFNGLTKLIVLFYFLSKFISERKRFFMIKNREIKSYRCVA